jgi:predicted O-methyltransferase YrrM
VNLENHPAGYRHVTLLLFGERVVVVPYPPCSELFKALAFAPDPQLAPATTEENYYQMYFAIASAVRPRTYLEIGTRFGYSTVAVARGSEELKRVVSCDLQTYDNPYLLSSQEIAERNLRSSGFAGETRFISDDSRRLAQHIAAELFDLILVDGDHSYEGCRSDILTCYEMLGPRGILMIDDLDQPPVFSAVSDCMRDLKIAVGDRCFVPTKHGLYLVRRAVPSEIGS